jgi:hypothetical protein
MSSSARILEGGLEIESQGRGPPSVTTGLVRIIVCQGLGREYKTWKVVSSVLLVSIGRVQGGVLFVLTFQSFASQKSKQNTLVLEKIGMSTPCNTTKSPMAWMPHLAVDGYQEFFDGKDPITSWEVRS